MPVTMDPLSSPTFMRYFLVRPYSSIARRTSAGEPWMVWWLGWDRTNSTSSSSRPSSNWGVYESVAILLLAGISQRLLLAKRMTSSRQIEPCCCLYSFFAQCVIRYVHYPNINSGMSWVVRALQCSAHPEQILWAFSVFMSCSDLSVRLCKCKRNRLDMSFCMTYSQWSNALNFGRFNIILWLDSLCNGNRSGGPTPSWKCWS